MGSWPLERRSRERRGRHVSDLPERRRPCTERQYRTTRTTAAPPAPNGIEASEGSTPAEDGGITVGHVEFSDVVRRRRMVHVFRDRPVDASLVDGLLDLARRGPSAGFSQGTDFVVLDEPTALERFWNLTEDPRFPREPDELDASPPVLVVLVADPGRYIERYSRPDKIAFGLDQADAWPVKFWDTDTAKAGMLLLLAAVDAGLGGWYFGIPYGEGALRQELGIPDDRNIIGVIGLGYPGVDERPQGSAYSLSRRPLHEMVHRNHW